MNEHLEHNNLISKWLNGELSKEEVEKIEAGGELDDLKFVLEDIGTWKLPNFDVQKGLEDLRKRRVARFKSPSKTIRLRPLLAYAAVIALLIATYFGWNTYVKSGETRIATAVGETATHELPDGSVVQLDASSEIAYNASTWDKARDISLKGQAFFKVKKGERFKVKLPLGTVQVLGTQFNVLASKKTLEVKCFEGEVKVKTKDDTIVLTKGEGAILKDGSLSKFEVIAGKPGWLEGHTIYDNAQLSQVIEDLKKYYDITIKLPRKYTKLKFSGKVPHNDLKLALKNIFMPMEIPYTLTKDGKVIFLDK